MLKLAVMISEKVSLLRALIDSYRVGEIEAEIALVICSQDNPKGLELAAQAGIVGMVIKHEDYPDRETFDRALHHALQKHRIEFVCLAQFDRLLTPWFVEQWWDRLTNCHPSLLPSFKGGRVCSRVLNAGVKFTGCTVHFVRPPMDKGPIIIQGLVPVLPEDTPAKLRGRVLKVEKHCVVQAMKWITTGRVKIVNECVFIEGVDFSSQILLNPCAE